MVFGYTDTERIQLNDDSLWPADHWQDDPEGNPVTLCLGAAVDQQTIAEVFDNYIAACRILNVRNELLETITGQRGRLREGFILGSDGRILEWDREYGEFEPGHVKGLKVMDGLVIDIAWKVGRVSEFISFCYRFDVFANLLLN